MLRARENRWRALSPGSHHQAGCLMGRLTCAPADAGHLVTVHPVLGGGSQRRGRPEASPWPRGAQPRL